MLRYVIQIDARSLCPDCKKSVDLLAPKTAIPYREMFYICWSCKKVFQSCKKIFQVGVGPVERENE